MATAHRMADSAPLAGSADAETPEVHDLIGSDRVDGTSVYRSNGDKIGTIKRIMIDKRSGRAAYAVMRFGGFLGIGEELYPLPWSLLTYSPELGGYEVNLTDDQLKRAPNYLEDEGLDFGDRDRDAAISGYYGVPPYWL